MTTSTSAAMDFTAHVFLNELMDIASGPFSFLSRGVRLTYDSRKPYNKLIIAREWK